MRFHFLPGDSLPRLAWCARLRRGRDAVEVRHGPWVETTETWFVDGTWSGPYAAGGVLEASHFVGTAGRVEPGRVIFSSGSNLFDPVYLVRVDDELYAANSFVFLLRATGDAPDPGHLYYAADRLGHVQSGLRRRDKRLRTARGRSVGVYDACDVAVGADLVPRRFEKPTTPAPRDYADYVARLEGTIAAVQANAADPARRRCRYRPLATISRGYDSPALAVLMRRHGAREALTFANPGDDGTDIGERLGYVVTAYDPGGFRRLGGAAEPEFCATPPGIDVPMAVCEPQLAGALLVTGRARDLLLGVRGPAPPDLQGWSVGTQGGTTMGEFRLRVGFLQFTPYYAAALHPEAIHRISVSAEMKPWSVGGAYDKPIARRLLEEAGIARDWFGRSRHGSAFTFMRRPTDMSSEAAADFAAFLAARAPVSLRRRIVHRARVLAAGLRVDGIRRRIARVLGLRPPHRPVASSMTISTIEMGLMFHWGCARIGGRYDGRFATDGPDTGGPRSSPRDTVHE